MASLQWPLFLSLGLLSAAFLASAQPFLTQGGGPVGQGAVVVGAPPAPLATPKLFTPITVAPTPTQTMFLAAGNSMQVNGKFTVLLDLIRNYVNTTELLNRLTFPATLFAPTDAAFAVVPKSVLEGVKENPNNLLDLLTYHFVNGFFPGAALLAVPTPAPTSIYQNQPIVITVTNGQAFIGVGQPLSAVTPTDVFLQPPTFVVHGCSMVLAPPGFVLYNASNPTDEAGVADSVLPDVLPVTNGTLAGNVLPPGLPTAGTGQTTSAGLPAAGGLPNALNGASALPAGLPGGGLPTGGLPTGGLPGGGLPGGMPGGGLPGGMPGGGLPGGMPGGGLGGGLPGGGLAGGLPGGGLGGGGGHSGGALFGPLVNVSPSTP